MPIEDWQQTETEILINRNSLEEGLNLFSTIVEIDVKDPISGAQMKTLKRNTNIITKVKLTSLKVRKILIYSVITLKGI